ncbi:MAG: hypothetical protein HN519_09535 [Hellea sp.]|nr:hypothetical protein [Hellea sp.]
MKIETRERKTPTDLYSMIFVSLLVGIVGLLFANKAHIELNAPDVCGIYCNMAMNYWQLLEARDFDVYYFSKSFSSFLAWVVVSATGASNTPMTINYVLEGLNGLYLAVAAFFWCLICSKKNISRQAAWIGFLGMFLTHLFIGLTPHAQESPDNGAFAISLAILYFYVIGSMRGLLCTFALSAFIQPQLKILVIPVIIMLGSKVDESSDANNIRLPKKIQRITEFLCNFLQSIRSSDARHLFVWITFFALMYVALSVLAFFLVAPYFGTDQINVRLLPISILLQSIFLGYCLFKLDVIQALYLMLRKTTNRVFLRRLLVCLIILLLIKGVTVLFAQGPVSSLNSTLIGRLFFIYTFLQQSVQQPGMSLVIHMTFYGPLIGLFVINWHRMAENTRAEGPAFVLVFALILMISNGIESRHLIACLPWFTIILCMGLKKLPPVLFGSIIVMQILASRVYAPYRSDYSNESDPYLMIWGPWVSLNHYWDYFWVAIAGFLLLSSVWFYYIRCKLR